MTNLCCVRRGKYRKLEKPKISYLSQKTVVLSIIWSKYKNDEKKYLRKKIQLRYQRFLV